MAGHTTIRQLRLCEICIPFKLAFRHASADRTRTSSVWVEAVSASGVIGYGESCPRPYVTGESIASVRAFVSRYEASICGEVVDLGSARAWIAAHAGEVDRNPAAWCAVEMAVLDVLAKERAQTIEALLTLPPLTGRFSYSAVVGDSDPDTVARTVEQYRRQGFTDFKIKLSGDRDRDRAKVALLRDGSARIRVDANNLWEDADAAIGFLRGLACPFFAVEEPIRPNQYGALARMADSLSCRIVLDESFVRVGQIASLGANPSRWLINLRVSKMGGLLRSVHIVEGIRAGGFEMIVGAQVGETSLLTRAALTVAHAGRDRLVAQEGAFGTHLLTADVCNPPLMFGPGGVLDVSSFPSLQGPGFGIVDPTQLDPQILRSLDP
jgi:L-alanine-DL-glutamate epimerase-like enolase superfamily enzyme